MKRKTWKKVSLLIIIAVMILTVTGCGDKKEKSKQTSSEAVQESQSTSGDENQKTSDEGQESTFDFSQAFDNVEVNGKKVPFPFTLNDLGEDFTVESIVEMGDGTCGASLCYKGEIVADVYMNINNKKDFGNNTSMYKLVLSRNYNQAIKINRIDCNKNKNNVCENFKEFNNKNKEMEKVEERKGDNYLLITFNDDESIRSIYLGRGE